MKKVLLTVVLILIAAPLFASLDAYFIALDSPFYEAVDELYVLEGMTRPSDARPYSASEAQIVLERINRSSLSGYSATLYDKALSYLDETIRWRYGTFGFGAHLGINPEIYYHVNNEDFRNEESWIYSYDDRERFLHLGLEFSVSDFFYTYCDLMYTIGRYYGDGEIVTGKDDRIGRNDYPDGIGAILPVGNNNFKIIRSIAPYNLSFSTNIPFKSKDFEFEWPKRAFISFGGDHWALLFGRDRINWGNSRVSNFLIDSHVGYHDMIRFKAFSENFNYEWTNLFFDTRGAANEIEEEGIRMLMAHRLEFRFLPWLSFAISEDVMYQSKVLSPQYINPGNIFHNLNNRSMFNAIAHAELNITAFKGFEIYAQAVLDQATAPNEDNSQSPAWGILGGLEYSFSPSKGVLSFNAEFNYTSPVLYRRDAVDFLMYQRSFSYDESYPLKLYYIGYKYGGDVMLLHLGISYSQIEHFKIGLSFDRLLKGEMDMAHKHNEGGNSEVPYYPYSTPSGDEITRVMILTMNGEYNIPSLPSWMSIALKGSVSLVGSDTYVKSTKEVKDAKSDIQLSFALSVKI